MCSQPLTCSLLRTLAASKPNGNLLELGSGSGLSTAWLLDGMNDGARLTTVDNDPALLSILEKHLGSDHRLAVICADGDEFISKIEGKSLFEQFLAIIEFQPFVCDALRAVLNHRIISLSPHQSFEWMRLLFITVFADCEGHSSIPSHYATQLSFDNSPDTFWENG